MGRKTFWRENNCVDKKQHYNTVSTSRWGNKTLRVKGAASL